MKNVSLILFSMIFACSALTTCVEARAGGGRGGGGGNRAGGGGGNRPAGGAARDYRGGNNFNRTPSMSRANPSRNVQVGTPANRPNVSAAGKSQFANQGNAAQNARRGNYAQNPATKNQLNQFLQQSKPGNIRPQNAMSNAASAQRPFNSQLGNNARNALNQNHPDYKNWFNGGFNNQHNNNLPYGGAGAAAAVGLWRGANWSSAANWMGGGWDSPYYYSDDGSMIPPPPEPVYVESSTTNVYNQPIVQSNVQDNQQADLGDWLPLGVFAIGKDASVVNNASMFLQLALNKQGEIAGTYYNSSTDKTSPVEGLVDNQTQLVAIQLSDNPSSPILKTGIYNLTQDQTNVTIFFPDNSQQNWIMVRLKQ